MPFTDINQCFKDAGALYGVHPNLLWAIAKVESGLNPMAINRNLNGTVDIGIMQINSSWIPVLKAYGLKDERYLWEPCYNIHVGAWVLAQCIKKFGYTWEAVGCYNATSKTKWQVFLDRGIVQGIVKKQELVAVLNIEKILEQTQINVEKTSMVNNL